MDTFENSTDSNWVQRLGTAAYIFASVIFAIVGAFVGFVSLVLVAMATSASDGSSVLLALLGGILGLCGPIYVLAMKRRANHISADTPARPSDRLVDPPLQASAPASSCGAQDSLPALSDEHRPSYPAPGRASQRSDLRVGLNMSSDRSACDGASQATKVGQMTVPGKRWIFLGIAGCALAFALISFATPSFTSATATTMLRDAIANSEEGRPKNALVLTGTSALAVLDRQRASDAYTQRIIQDVDKAVRMSDPEYAAFVQTLDNLNRSHDISTYGTIPNTSEISLCRTLWKSGNIERLKWTSSTSSFGTTLMKVSAIPIAAVRKHCISYSEGDDACKYIAAVVALKSVDGIITQDNFKRVEFTVHVEPTPEEITLKASWPVTPGRSNRTWKAFDAQRIATFTRYDDGWRLTNWTLGTVGLQIPY